MKQNQAIKTGVMIAGGVLGLGLLGYCFLRAKAKPKIDADVVTKDGTPSETVEVPQGETPTPPAVNTKPKRVEPEEPQANVRQTKKALEPQRQPNDNFPLKLGSKGPRVQQLQVYLLRHHGSAGVVTDTFDATTAARVKRFLKVNTITAALFEALNIAGKTTTPNNGTTKTH